MLTLLAAPAPRATTRGKNPAREATAVKSIGRSLNAAASRIAALTDLPSCKRWFANSTIKIPFFAARLINTKTPTWP